MERELVWLSNEPIHETKTHEVARSHHDLLSEAYRAISHALDTYGSESQEYQDACARYGRQLLNYWELQMSYIQAHVAPKARTEHEQQMDSARGERTLKYEELPQGGGERRYLSIIKGGHSLYVDSNVVPRVSIFLQIGNPHSFNYDQVSLRVINGLIDEIDAPKISSIRDDVSFEVVLRQGTVNTIIRIENLPGGIEDIRTIRRRRTFGTT